MHNTIILIITYFQPQNQHRYIQTPAWWKSTKQFLEGKSLLIMLLLTIAGILPHISAFFMDGDVSLNLSLNLKIDGFFFFFLVSCMEWCIRKPGCSSIILYNITGITHNHRTDILNTDIYPLFYT